jgi:hypothetical protein
MAEMLMILGLTLGFPKLTPADDLKAFQKNYTPGQAWENARLATQCAFYLSRPHNRPERISKTRWSELIFEQLKVDRAHSSLKQAIQFDPSEEKAIRSALADLRNELSPEDYKAGKLPLPVPPEIRQDFEVWLKKQGK